LDLPSKDMTEETRGSNRPKGGRRVRRVCPEVPLTSAEQVLARLLLADTSGLVTAMSDRVALELPMIADLAPEVQADMREWTARVTTASLELVARGESLDTLGPEIAATARRRRAQRIDQEQSQRGYEFAQQALVDEVARRIRGRADEAALFSAFTRRLLEFQRVAAVHLTAGFTGPDEPEEHRRHDDEGQRLLERICGRRDASADEEAGGVRMRVTLPLRVAATSTVQPDAYAQLRAVRRANPWSVAGVLDGRVVVVAARRPRELPEPNGVAQQDPGDNVAIATKPVGEDVDAGDVARPAAVASAVRRAGHAADVAHRLGESDLAYPDASPLHAMIALPESDRSAYLRGCFGDLPGTARGDAMLHTVATTFTNPRAADAARVLHIHRHTLEYRLRRFEEETGTDLSDPASRFRCQIGLFLLGRLPVTAADLVMPVEVPGAPDQSMAKVRLT
jgi:hypothetical protein